ncbi:MAG TPA: DUF2975 domain-containing protein [Rhizomicrobium sp.]|jgi:hypothetical protein
MPSQVIPFSQATPAHDAPMRPHEKLLKLSRALEILFAALIAVSLLWIFAAAVATVFFSNHLLIGPTGAWFFTGRPPAIPGGVLYSSQPPLTRLAGMIDIVTATVPLILVCRHLRELFRLYARGTVFARENAVHLKRAGLWLVVYPFAKVAANIIFRLAGGADKVWFHMELVYALVLGLIVFAIALVMEFGREIEQEKDSFI